MGITAISKPKTTTTTTTTTDNWGMELLLVFFPEDTNSSSAAATTSTPPTANILDKPIIKTIKRTNSNNPILTKTQSTISICALLLFLTLLLFTLSTFEPSIPSATLKTPRRLLPEKFANANINNSTTHHRPVSWFSGIFTSGDYNGRKQRSEFVSSSFALQGMGKLYFRGTKAMNDLVVGHVVEDTSEDDFRVFLRLLHRSGITAKADVVFIFPSSSSSASRFSSLIRDEVDSFMKLVQHYKELNSTSRDSVSAGALRFDVAQFVKHGKKEMAEPLWGKRIRVNNYNESEETSGESIRLSYGSVVGFETSELDPENSLDGFLDHVPMSLKRWACYPMLLGRVRRNFKHVMLIDVKKSLILADPLGRVRSRSPESVYISTKQESGSPSKHGKRNSDKTQSHSQVNSAILTGGARGIRRFSSAMLTEIVRAAMQHKKKSLVTESAIVSQLVSNRHILKNIDLTVSAESIPDASSLIESPWNHHKIIQRGNVNYDVNSIIMKHICSCEVESSVYRDC